MRKHNITDSSQRKNNIQQRREPVPEARDGHTPSSGRCDQAGTSCWSSWTRKSSTSSPKRSSRSRPPGKANGATIYASRRFALPSELGDSVLCDYGSAVSGNLGSLRGPPSFLRARPEKKKYMTRVHPAEVVGMLGPPPLDFLSRGQQSNEFFTGGEWKAEDDIPKDTSLASSVARLEGKDKDMFLSFVGGMLQWRPDDARRLHSFSRTRGSKADAVCSWVKFTSAMSTSPTYQYSSQYCSPAFE